LSGSAAGLKRRSRGLASKSVDRPKRDCDADRRRDPTPNDRRRLADGRKLGDAGPGAADGVCRDVDGNLWAGSGMGAPELNGVMVFLCAVADKWSGSCDLAS
jgi:sugar lactone lactonase YvrE